MANISITTRMISKIQPVGIAVPNTQPILDFVVNKSSAYDAPNVMFSGITLSDEEFKLYDFSNADVPFLNESASV